MSDADHAQALSDADAEAKAEADAGASTEDETEARAWIQSQSDSAVVIAYQLPKEHVGLQLVLQSGLVEQCRRLDDISEERFRLNRVAFGAPRRTAAEEFERMREFRRLDAESEELRSYTKAAYGAHDESVGFGTLYYAGPVQPGGLPRRVVGCWKAKAQPCAAGRAHGELHVQRVPQNEQIILILFYGVTKQEDSGRWHMAPIRSFRLEVRTNIARWARTLEAHGLSSMIQPFQSYRITAFSDWAEFLDDEELQQHVKIDPGSLDKLGKLLAGEGFLTESEKKRLEAEQEELEAKIDEIEVALTESTADFFVGQLVKGTVLGREENGVVLACEEENVVVRWGDGEKGAPMPRAEVTPAQWHLFLSHAQVDAADQVAQLRLLLRDVGVEAWLDMDALEITENTMCRGIMESNFFCLYLTEHYFERWFCRMEACFARRKGKQLLVVFEADPRHGGDPDYVRLVDRATAKYRGFRDWILSTEAIPMARRRFQRKAMISEILRRIGVEEPHEMTKIEKELHDEVTILRHEVSTLWTTIDVLQSRLSELEVSSP